jgi:hypothetical protein
MLFSMFCADDAYALLVTPYGGSGDTLTSLLSTVNISTGGSGGEDRLTDVLDTVFVSTGGSGGEDRLTDIFDTFSVSTGGSGGEDRITQLFNAILNPANGTSLSEFLGSISLTSPTSTVSQSAFDLFDTLRVSAAVADTLEEFDAYRVDPGIAVPEPAPLFLLTAGLVLLLSSRKRQPNT